MHSVNFKSHSQAGQDIFVHEMTEHKTEGFYVDIGCNVPEFHSNTYALETYCGWTGLLTDIVGGCEKRRGIFVQSDAANPNERLKFNYSIMPAVVDYLSLDADDATLGAFSALPWDRVTFRTLTIETDVYRKGPEDRDKMRSLLSAMGYLLVCGDVVVEWPKDKFVPYEDWWCSPQHVSPDLIKKYKSEGKYWREIPGLT